MNRIGHPSTCIWRVVPDLYRGDGAPGNPIDRTLATSP